MPRTSWTPRATSGERYDGWTCAKGVGNSRMRPSENHVLVVAFELAFALATMELTIARKTTTQPAFHTSRETPSHGLPPPNSTNLFIRSAPKKTVAAYVVSR